MRGFVYGQGVRCAGGSLLRLYTKIASGTNLRTPDFLERDPPVLERSADLGEVIRPGESRFYFVSYRDPIVLGSCPSTSTFNATPTAIVTWSP